MKINDGRIILFLFLLLVNVWPASARGAVEAGGRAEISSDFDPGRDYFPEKASVRYAEGFTVEYGNNYKILAVSRPWPDASVGFEYILVQRGTPAPAGHPDAQVIEIPVKTLVTMSTTYLSYIDLLGLQDVLIGHDNFRYVNNPGIRKRIREGKIREVGEGPNVNIELLLDLEPELIMAYGLGNEWDSHPKILEAGFKVAVNGDWAEESPLGRAEWIKFLALFFNRESSAERIFSSIARQYEELAAKTKNIVHKPTVLLDAPYQGTWWIAGGNSFMARLLKDAGADYLWADDSSFFRIPLDFEAVYERASVVDLWLNTGSWHSLEDALAADERFKEFRAFARGAIYNNNARVNEFGGNDFWESGPANPHEILKDLIKIIHPELVPDHELMYYRRLPERN